MDVLDHPLATPSDVYSLPLTAPGSGVAELPAALPYSRFVTGPLHLPFATFRYLLELQGPSLALWRAAEVAALREQRYEPPVLDLGCGDGLVTSMILPRVDIGLDPDPQPLQRADRCGFYDRLIAAPIEEAAIPAGSVATVVSNSVLEHIPRIDGALAAVARALRPGGRLIFTAPTEAFSGWLAFPWPRYTRWRNQQLAHLNLWSATCWGERLHRAGLEIVLVRPYLRRPLVSLWDALELTQQVWLGSRRLVGMFWRRIPSSLMDHFAHWGTRLDLSAPAPGGGQLIVARKPLSSS